ncbi:hypothetical protein Dimus_025055 [Dionaea muscipula]
MPENHQHRFQPWRFRASGQSVLQYVNEVLWRTAMLFATNGDIVVGRHGLRLTMPVRRTAAGCESTTSEHEQRQHKGAWLGIGYMLQRRRSAGTSPSQQLNHGETMVDPRHYQANGDNHGLALRLIGIVGGGRKPSGRVHRSTAQRWAGRSARLGKKLPQHTDSEIAGSRNLPAVALTSTMAMGIFWINPRYGGVREA